MKKILVYIISKFLTPEKIAKLLAGVIANLLRKASSSNHWDTIKGVIVQVENACHIFNEVYADESLSKDDESRIAKAIENLTSKTDLKSILAKSDIML